MKKNLSKILLSVFTLLIVLSFIGTINAKAVETPDQTIEVQGEAIQTQLQSNVRTMFCFGETSRFTVSANVGLEIDINFEAARIEGKDIIIEVEGDRELRMTMTCTREEKQLGLTDGNLHRVRNRHQYRYLEGICIAMDGDADCNCKCKCDPECTCECDCECKYDCECKCDCDPECKCDSECPYDGAFLKARLRIRETNQNRKSQWAYYDKENKEMVTVPTISEDGYLTAETTVLSTWALLVPEETTSSPFVGTVALVSVFAIGIVAISAFYLIKKRH